MRLLLDTCVWGGVKDILSAAGYDVAWAGDLPTDPGDEAVLARARGEVRVLITLDKDFGESAIVRGRPHRGIIRLVNVPSKRQALLSTRLLSRYGEELDRGAIVTALECGPVIAVCRCGPPTVWAGVDKFVSGLSGIGRRYLMRPAAKAVGGGGSSG